MRRIPLAARSRGHDLLHARSARLAVGCAALATLSFTAGLATAMHRDAPPLSTERAARHALEPERNLEQSQTTTPKPSQDPPGTRPAAVPATTTTAAPEPTTTPKRTFASAISIPVKRGALPVGKGMWLWQPERTEGGDVSRIVQRSVDVGLTHLYVRTGSSWMGFYAQDFLNRLLPVAHAAGIRVYGWDFPNLRDWRADADRGLAAIRYTTPDGHRIDGFAADIETRAEGTNLSAAGAFAYGTGLREGVGWGYPLISVVPRPSAAYQRFFPYPHAVAQFDAIAPMVYWINREPVGDVTGAMRYLRRFGKPVLPVGQAYDGGHGIPGRNQILAFNEAAEREHAAGVSYWVWQSATQEIWDAIRDSSQFVVYQDRPNMTGGRNVVVQTLLTSLGYEAPRTGDWDARTQEALRRFQRDHGLAVTGELDGDTRHRLLVPLPPPIRPLK